MPNQQHLELLLKGIEQWNAWREDKTRPQSSKRQGTASLSFIPSQGNGRRLLQRRAAIQQQVDVILESNVFSASHVNGSLVAAWEAAFAHSIDVIDAVALNSGSSALRAACELLQLPVGSEIIVPGLTFIMTAFAVNDAFAVDPVTGTLLKGGLLPVFVDVDPLTYTIDPEQVRAALTPRTRAIIAVHLLGQMADMRALRAIA